MSDRTLKEEEFQGISVIRPEARMVWLWNNSWSVEMVGGLSGEAAGQRGQEFPENGLSIPDLCCV